MRYLNCNKTIEELRQALKFLISIESLVTVPGTAGLHKGVVSMYISWSLFVESEANSVYYLPKEKPNFSITTARLPVEGC